MATRQTHKNRINQILRGVTKGLFSDNWGTVYRAFDSIEFAGYSVEIEKSEYRTDESGTPVEKFWLYQVSHPELKSSIPGILTAHGAGSVADPLDRYDISAYVS